MATGQLQSMWFAVGCSSIVAFVHCQNPFAGYKPSTRRARRGAASGYGSCRIPIPTGQSAHTLSKGDGTWEIFFPTKFNEVTEVDMGDTKIFEESPSGPVRGILAKCPVAGICD